MRCPSCEFDNRQGRRFCAECGAPLGGQCPSCGFDNDPGEKYCGGCGVSLESRPSGETGPRLSKPIAPTPAAQEKTTPARDARGSGEPERRQLTVMFCDLVGSTEFSRILDPEETREVIRAFQKTCTDVIGRFDGIVAKYMGDGILAYFGYPVAHEDDPERAVRSGLEIIEVVRGLDADLGRQKNIALAIRVGIATGLVVVGDLVGDGAAEEIAVVGATPNLAARLQSIAQPNTVVIASGTLQLLGAGFVCDDLGKHDLKGFHEPVGAWRVVGPSDTESRFEATHAADLTPFVGREHEIGLLVERWRQAKQGEGQVVLVSGEAGIGKSRISLAIQERIAEEPHARVRYQCSPYHRNSALHPVIEQLARAAGLRRNDTHEQKLDKLESLLITAPEGDGQSLALLASLLSLPTDGRCPPLDLSPERQKQQTLAALVEQMKRLAAHRPLLVVFEDVHWIDPTTLDLLDLVVDQAQTAPMLVMVTLRPEFVPTWTGQAHVTLLALNRMNRRQRAVMVEKVTGGKGLPEEVLDQIVTRTDGVPLFVEELTKAVIESGLLTEEDDCYRLVGPLPPLAIPSTLQDSLMARLDQMPSVKEVAQIGATIGREFSYELLSWVSPLRDSELREDLAKLVDSELLFRRGSPPNAVYIFKHALIRDTAYDSLLRGKRQDLHARIAIVLEERFPETTLNEPELLAHHFTEAGLAETAVEYWKIAGERALDGSANVEAVSHFTRGIEVLATMPDSAETARTKVELHTIAATTLRVMDRYDEALSALTQAEEMATTHGLTVELARIHFCRGNVYFPLGNVDGCLEQHELARKYAHDAGSPRDEACAIGGLGDAYYLQGRMRTAFDQFRRCVELAREHGFADVEAANLHMVGWCRMYLNELREAVADGMAAAEAAAKIRHRRAEMLGRLLAGFVGMDLGEFVLAKLQLDLALELARKLGAGNFEAEALAHKAHALCLEGRHAEARVYAEEALTITRRSGMTFIGPYVLAVFARTTDDQSIRQGALKEAEDILRAGCVSHNHFWFCREAIDICVETGAWNEIGRFAAALEDYTRDQPLPLSDFYIARGRALAAFGRGARDGKTIADLERLRDQALAIGLKSHLTPLERAIAAS
jgi:class 3 adenylate cyclase/tetratricopeptide (TPR) repeat protein/ABC-type transport system involved in cytochrome c biogenesis ATPase subunit